MNCSCSNPDCPFRAEVERLRAENDDLKHEIKALKERNEELLDGNKRLERRCNINPDNSSMPPSSRIFKKSKPEGPKKEGSRNRGGQVGHKGHNITVPRPPDRIVEHLPERCNGCPNLDKCRENGTLACSEKRTVIDVIMRTDIVEHRRIVAVCPMNENGQELETIKGTFPEDVTATVQYGNTLTALVGTLDVSGAMSDSRISDLVDSMFDITLSPGTVVNMVSRCSQKVKPVIEEIKTRLAEGDLIHFDETSTRVDGKTSWVHNASNELYTCLTIHQKRGKEGIEHSGIIEKFCGTAVHDCLSSYFKYNRMRHGICNAHILRELKGIEETEPDHRWPSMLRDVLLTAKAMKEDALSQGKTGLDPRLIEALRDSFDAALSLADMERPPLPRTGRKGRPRLGKERALIERLRRRKDESLLFVVDFIVPFDNNQAERDIRIMKIKTKVSNCFRSLDSAQDYLDIRSYLSTARKHGVGSFEAMAAAMTGNPFIVLDA